VICFGSLAQRSPGSGVAVESFQQNAPAKSLRIFDFNLRQSFCDDDVLGKSLRYPHIVKLNDQELHQVSRLLNLGVGTEETLAKRLLNEYGLSHEVCLNSARQLITRGYGKEQNATQRFRKCLQRLRNVQLEKSVGWTQNPPGFGPWGFNSPSRHQPSKPRGTRLPKHSDLQRIG
jgi:hypothetical protein